MITGELKSKVDGIWNTMWSGGISNPLSVIEQLTYLLFIKGLDELHTRKEHKAARTGKPIEEPVFAAHQDALRWSRFKEALRAVVEICNTPMYPRSNTVKRLSGHGGRPWRYRLGDRRLVYEPDEVRRMVRLRRFGPRGDVYSDL